MDNSHKIQIQQFDKKGYLEQKYTPLQNLIKDGDIGSFTTSKLSYNLKNYLNIDSQVSYDDSINLILNDNNDVPRIINTQFRPLGNNKYEYLVRNQKVQTNLYNEDTLNTTTDLYLRSKIWPWIFLNDVSESGQLMGGNYVFYIKYCDEDMNESEIVSESGAISIFKGNHPGNISGTLVDERTNKGINLKIDHLDNSFSQFYLYFSRETSDLNGISLTKYYKIVTPYLIRDSKTISITGYENIIEVAYEELFKRYNYFSAAKTQAVVQNMLFLGNVQTSERNYAKLQQASYKIGVTIKQKEDSIGYVNNDYGINALGGSEYYDPKNIYYYVGYWPDEYYSLGISYILADSTVTPSFPLLGKELKLNEMSLKQYDENLEASTIINEELYENTAGIFKLPKVEVIDHNKKEVKPLYFEFQFSQEAIDELLALGVEGYFFTRTKRIPTILFQGLSVGIDPYSGIPLPYISSGIKTGYVAESFLQSSDRLLTSDIDEHLRSIPDVRNHGLIALDAMVVPQIQNMLSWNEYTLEKSYECRLESEGSGKRRNFITSYDSSDEQTLTSLLVYIEKDIPSFKLDKYYFSTRTGTGTSVREFSFLSDRDLKEEATNLLRGIYCPVVGTNTFLAPSSIYTVKTKVKNPLAWVQTLIDNNTPYYSITNRYRLTKDTFNQKIAAYRGDCFTNTVTIRINRNFVDPVLPGNNEIIDEKTWSKNYKGSAGMSDKEDAENSWTNINLSDLNAVELGIWVTYKCLSNYNLGLRSLDISDVELLNKLGAKGSFYPISGLDTKTSGKVAESQLLNEGYGVTLSRNTYNKWLPTPYENWNFENRIAFSNIASTKMFTNGFRIFQGLAYQDVDKQFGQIVKLFPYGQNLLCVFEHGLAIVPINEKALLSTQEGLSIHLYGAGVLQEQVSVISPDYGSTWMESLIATPNAYYGVDASARKIWKYNNTEGFACISDFKIQSFLNEELQFDVNEIFFLGATNIRTHYNNFKGDVIFTFYNDEKAYSICYNELTKTWVSRYTWMPLLSTNIDNEFYSFDRSSISQHASLFKQITKTEGIVCENPIYNDKVSFKYKSVIPAKLKIKSISYNGNSYSSTNSFVPILRDTELGKSVEGIYYNDGIEKLFNHGGSIEHGIMLTNKPLQTKNSMPIFLFSEEPITLDIIPAKTFVAYHDGNLYITPYSGWEYWSVNAPGLSDGYYYITANIDLQPRIDSDGKMWFTTMITKEKWSEPKLYCTKEASNIDSSWKLITDYVDKTAITSEINFKDNEILTLCYLAPENKVNNLEYISSVPIIKEPNFENEEDLEYEYKELYSVYMWYDPETNEYNVHIPDYIIINGNVNITIEAEYKGEILEEHTFIISNSIQNAVSLYKHDIDAPITNWYGKQEPFEYEFVVSQPFGMHKIFNDLEIISNNAEPDSIEVEIVGDVYDFKNSIDISENLNIEEINNISIREGKSYKTYLKYDKIIKEYRFIMHQDCINIVNFGRRIGNISYIEGKWHAVLQPIYYKNKTSRLRDKWAKIRIKYSGDKLAIITAIQTLMNISYV